MEATHGLTLSEDNYFDAARALYWYASDYHGGQDSDLYSILSTSEYRPGMSEGSPSEDNDEDCEALKWYRALEAGLDPRTLEASIKLILDTK